jgi:hypothetical protein
MLQAGKERILRSRNSKTLGLCRTVNHRPRLNYQLRQPIRRNKPEGVMGTGGNNARQVAIASSISWSSSIRV